MEKNRKTYLRALAILLGGFLMVLFFESGRIEVLIRGEDTNPLSRVALIYASFSDALKKPLQGMFSPVEIQLVQTNPPAAESSTFSRSALPPFVLPTKPYTVLMIGDSFIADRFGITLEKNLRSYEGVTVFRDGIYSTGLSRPDYFDWMKELEKQGALHNPNVVVVMFGANDGQDIVMEDTRVIHYGSKEWGEEYGERVKNMMAFLREKNILVFWIGNPIARSSSYREKMSTLNTIDENALRNYTNARFIPTWDTLKNEGGNYSDYLKNNDGKIRLARTSDGIHVTEFGAELLLKVVTPAIARTLSLTSSSTKI